MHPIPINNWPATERPRERLLLAGAAQLSDTELIAILLGSGMAGATAVDLARLLIERFGGIRGTLNAPQQDLLKIRGLGNSKVALLGAARECAGRYLRQQLKPGATIGSPGDSRQYLLAALRDKPHEVFGCLFLDNRHRVSGVSMSCFAGQLTQRPCIRVKLLSRALARNAAAVILAHNHPSGVAEPSDSDRLITQRIRAALELIDIRLLDHFRHRGQLLCLAGKPRNAVKTQDSLACGAGDWYKTRLLSPSGDNHLIYLRSVMSRVCQVTGKKPMAGNNVSHANNRNASAVFLPNLHTKRIWVESEQRYVKLRVSQKRPANH